MSSSEPRGHNKGEADRLAPLMSSANTDWETPPELFAALHEEFHFVLDVCASPENAKCPRYYTERENGLIQLWFGPAWMNPPYGNAISDWVAKAAAEAKRGVLTVCLVPARTDTRWWWDYALQADEIRFLKGRLRFVGAASGATFPSALVIYQGQPSTHSSPVVNWWTPPRTGRRRLKSRRNAGTENERPSPAND